MLLELFKKVRVGVVLKVLFFLVQGKSRKIFISSGICVKVSKKGRTFTLQNFHGKEKILVNFIFSSPYIIRLQELSSYNFSLKKKRAKIFRDYRLSY
jgi:hypothetical protein